jgi:hypothetical protein
MLCAFCTVYQCSWVEFGRGCELLATAGPPQASVVLAGSALCIGGVLFQDSVGSPAFSCSWLRKSLCEL